uniref:Ig-like domain-containing protein n=1 Tax=Poecilia mexicana TaxID=48701 RepID=A0A3B3Y929_9TELE
MSMLSMDIDETASTVQTGFMTHELFRCHFNSSELQDIHYSYSYIYNKVEFIQFDSRVGSFVGLNSFGEKLAARWNNGTGWLNVSKTYREEICQPNAELWYRLVLDRSVAPSVTLSTVVPPTGGPSSMLTCSVYGFFPKQIRVTWMRNGQKVTSDVTSTTELPDGAWLYQIHSSLEFKPRSGEKISCMVEHLSLEEPLTIDWSKNLHDSVAVQHLTLSTIKPFNEKTITANQQRLNQRLKISYITNKYTFLFYST